MRSYVPGFFILVISIKCFADSPVTGYRNGFNNGHLDISELARQNRITQQILEHYLEKRLFPGMRRPSKRVPTVWEILPKLQPSGNNIQDKLRQGNHTPDSESLQSVESEQVSAIYEDLEESEGTV